MARSSQRHLARPFALHTMAWGAGVHGRGIRPRAVGQEFACGEARLRAEGEQSRPARGRLGDMLHHVTARTTLRELAATDAPFVLELLNEPAFIRGVRDQGVRNLKQAVVYIEQG